MLLWDLGGIQGTENSRDEFKGRKSQGTILVRETAARWRPLNQGARKIQGTKLSHSSCEPLGRSWL